MKKTLLIILGLVGVLVLLGFILGPKFYNTGIDLQEDATAQWANVESSYQRRSDLIPNIVNTAKGYA